MSTVDRIEDAGRRSVAREDAAREVVGYPTAALVAAAIGVAAALGSRLLGPVGALFALSALVVAYGRGRRWFVSRVLAARPRILTFFVACYVPFFIVDLFIMSGSGIVVPLVRLVVLLLVAEVLAGDPARPHRPLLLGLLLLVSTASETTEIWYAAAFLGFAVASALAQIRATMLEHQPAGAPEPRGMRPASVAGLVAGSLLLGGAIFFAIPRLGAGWGPSFQNRSKEAGIETGLSESVNLETIGIVKRRGRIAFSATLRGASYEPENIYWRARSYSSWTGRGWVQDIREREIEVQVGEKDPVILPGGSEEDVRRGVEARIEMRLDSPSLLVPGRPLWIKTGGFTRILMTSDGSLRAMRGRSPRRYTVGLRGERAIRAAEQDPGGSGSTEDDSRDLATLLDSGIPEASVREWAGSLVPRSTDPSVIASALQRDLRGRAYSLDTRAVDPQHPIASFLAGAPGHCEYFASAMALGLRLRGIPSRVVAGYLGADRLPFSERLLVRESRAHVWVEARLPDRGWVRYDPTPDAGRVSPSELGYRLRGAWEGVVQSWDAFVVGLDSGDQEELLLGLQDAAIGAVRAIRGAPASRLAVAGGLVLLGIGILIRLGLRRRAGRRQLAGVPYFYLRLLRIAAGHGLSPGPAETSREFAERAATALGEEGAVRLLSLHYERARFGGCKPGAESSTAIQAALARLEAL